MGPILGGVIGATIGWRWIFWFLCIVSGTCLALIVLSLPETARNLVGNGSVKPAAILRLPIPRIMGSERSHAPHSSAGEAPKHHWHIPNPIACLKVLSRRDTFIVVTAGGIIYMAYSCLQASLSTLCIEIYGLGQLEAGLIYLPFGFGSIAMTLISGLSRFPLNAVYPKRWTLAVTDRSRKGKILDRDYRLIAQRHNLPVDKVRGDNLLTFPVEKARLRSAVIPIVVTAATMIGYGWSLHFHAVRPSSHCKPIPFPSPFKLFTVIPFHGAIVPCFLLSRLPSSH